MRRKEKHINILCIGMGGMGVTQPMSISEAFSSFIGSLALAASQFLIILSSGPALAILTALVLILAIAALIRVLFTRRQPARHEGHRSNSGSS